MELCWLVSLALSPACLVGGALAYVSLRYFFKYRGLKRLTASIPGPPPSPYFGHLGLFSGHRNFAGGALAYVSLRYFFKYRGLKRLTASIPGPPPSPYFGHLGLFSGHRNFAEVSRFVYRTFDKYGPIFKLWMAHELWVCIADNVLAKEITQFWSSYLTVPSHNFFQFAREQAYVKKNCSFNVKLYESNPKPTVHQERVDQASSELVTGLKEKARRGVLSSEDLRRATQACMKRYIKDIDWRLEVREEYKDKIYLPFLDRMDIFMSKCYQQLLLVFINIMKRFGENLEFYDNVYKLESTSIYDNPEKESPTSTECRISVKELNFNFPEGPADHMNGVVSEHVADQLSECAEKCGVFLVNLLQDVASQPEILRKLREEAERVRTTGRSVPSLAQERSLYYTEMVIKEGLRLYSPPVVFYRTGKDFRSGDKVVPAGTVVYIAAEHFHSNFKFYENATSFDPEHFALEKMRKAPDGIFYPLDLEVPYCTDCRLVLKLMKMILSSLAGNFSLETNITPESVRHDFFLLNENLKSIDLKCKPL